MKSFYLLVFLTIFFIPSKFTAQQKTYVPDNNFEQALIDLGYDNTLDNYVSTSKINAVTDLDIRFKNISDLTGIDSFTGLTHLYCSANNLTSLDLSNNTALAYLDCGLNNLDALNISANKSLTVLYCDYNNLVDLNVNNDNNVNFTIFDASNNPNLNCIDVDNTAYSNSNWLNKDETSNYCGDSAPIPSVDLTYIPDNNFEQSLIDLGYDDVLDDYIPTNNLSNITYLDVSKRGIKDLTGIEDFVNLRRLFCYNNQITNLDSVKQNKALTQLDCSDNQLTSLDLSQHTKLISLDCSENQLTSLDLRNGNNSNFTAFNAENNPNLSCIKVDDATYSTISWLNIDGTSSYSINCVTTDDNTYVRISAGGTSTIKTTDQGPNWEANPDNGPYTGNSFAVDTGLNYSSELQYDDRDASIPDYVDAATFAEIFARERTAPVQEMEFTVPLANGNYTVNLFMGNSWDRGSEPGTRVFDILLEGKLVEDNMDPVATFGHKVAGMKSYSVTVTDGMLNIKFDNEIQKAYINAIEIIGQSNTQIPVPDNNTLVRISAGGTSTIKTTDQGPNWEANPDNGPYTGNSFAVDTGLNYSSELQYDDRDASIPDYVDAATFAEIFARERTAPVQEMEFTVPLANGNYTVNLFMGNSWDRGSEPGTRVFDILLEGKLVEDNMDPVATFGHRVAGMKSYPVTVSDGILNIKFDNEVQKAYINAIEIKKQIVNLVTSQKSSKVKKIEAVDSNTLSTNQLSTNNYKLYPNPANDIFNISLEYGIKLEQVNIFNGYGQQVHSAKSTTINISHLSQGIYIVQIETNLGNGTKKLIVK